MVRQHQTTASDYRKDGMRSGKRFCRTACRLALALCVLSSGCLQRDESVSYPFHNADVQYYQDVALEVDYPTIVSPTPEEIAFSQPPRTVLSRDLAEPWDMPLMEAVHLALHNNQVIRSAGQFLSPGNQLLTNGLNTPSVFDPGINESGVLFGNRGVEAALSAFDTTFTTNMIWGRNEQVQNNPFFAGGLTPGATLTRETGDFDASLRKDFAYGGQIQLNHTVNYQGSNTPNQLFPSNYTGLAQALYRQPLWAGAGTEYTRIAGPITQQFGGLSGVTQGVVIARINTDITIADFQAAIRNLVKDVEDAYWDLYLAYRNYDTAVTARNAALATWRFADIRVELGGNIDVADESQARDQYFAAQALVETTRSNLFTSETRLRRLLGLAVNEGRVIRPADEPITAEFTPDWQLSLTEALLYRVELRKQKWNIKSLDLQLIAARSLTQPRLDFVAGYQVNGFGDDLLSYDDDDVAGTSQGLNSYYETLTQGNQTGWSLGFQFNMPIGFRSAHAQVRNIELRLAKAQQVLHAQELEVAQELAVAFQELTSAYASARLNYNRRKAAIDNVSTIEKQVLGEIKTVDEILRAQERRAQAEVAFFTAIVDYNQALTNLQFRKGTLLQDTNVTLMEDGWNPDAYVDAYRRAQARSAALDAPHKHTEPEDFSSGAPVGTVQFAEPLPPLGPTIHEEFSPVPAERVAPLPADEGTPLPAEPAEPLPFEADAGRPADETVLIPATKTALLPADEPARPAADVAPSPFYGVDQSPVGLDDDADWYRPQGKAARGVFDEPSPAGNPFFNTLPARTRTAQRSEDFRSVPAAAPSEVDAQPQQEESEGEIAPIGFWRAVR